MSFFGRYSVTLNTKKHRFNLHGISMQKRKKINAKQLNSFTKQRTAQKTVIPPFQQLKIPILSEANYNPTNRSVQATPAFDGRDELLGRTELDRGENNVTNYKSP